MDARRELVEVREKKRKLAKREAELKLVLKVTGAHFDEGVFEYELCDLEGRLRALRKWMGEVYGGGAWDNWLRSSREREGKQGKQLDMTVFLSGLLVILFPTFFLHYPKAAL